MKLEISGKDVGEPTAELISKVVHDQDFRGEFFILISDDGSYLQATGPNDELHVEYRDAETQKHMYSSSKMTCDDLAALCMNYISELPDWNKLHEWALLEDYKPDNPDSQATWSITGF